MNETIDIVADLDAFIGESLPPMRTWFNEHPEVWAAIESRVIDGDAPAQRTYHWLVERYAVPFGDSTFRALIRNEKRTRRIQEMQRRREQVTA